MAARRIYRRRKDVRMDYDEDHVWRNEFSRFMSTKSGRKLINDIEQNFIVRVKKYDPEWEAIAVGSPLEAEKLAALDARIRKLQLNMTDYSDKGKQWLAMTRGSRISDMGTQNLMYQRNLMLAVMTPLNNGVSFSSICGAVGMWWGISLTNPQFKKYSMDMFSKGMTSVANHLGKAGEKTENSLFLAAPSALLKGSASALRKKADKYMAIAHDGRIPYTPESAALMDLRMDREAYSMMRDGKHTVEDVREMYDEARQTLYDLAAADGVSQEDIIRYKATIVGRMVREDPAHGCMFKGIVNDGLRMAEPEMEEFAYVDPSGNVVVDSSPVWKGEWQNPYGEVVDIQADDLFGVRDIMSEDELSDSVFKVTSDQFENGVTSRMKDGQTFDEAVMDSMKDAGQIYKYASAMVFRPELPLTQEDVEYIEQNRKYVDSLAIAFNAAYNHDGMSEAQISRATGFGVCKSISEAMNGVSIKVYGVQGLYMNRFASIMSSELYKYDPNTPEYSALLDSMTEAFGNAVATPKENEGMDVRSDLKSMIKNQADAVRYAVRWGVMPEKAIQSFADAEEASLRESLQLEELQKNNVSVYNDIVEFSDSVQHGLNGMVLDGSLVGRHGLKYMSPESFASWTCEVPDDAHMRTRERERMSDQEKAQAAQRRKEQYFHELFGDIPMPSDEGYDDTYEM